MKMPKIKLKKYWGGFFPEYELRRRETGFKRNLGWECNVKYALYSSLLPSTSWDPLSAFATSNGNMRAPNIHHGGVFNLEFSPDGRHLVAACERKAIMVFDPLTRRRIHEVDHAHSNCVNCIKFLDNRVFASCSDDKTVALWDVRNLKRKIIRLNGHTNWVKNIEYSPDDSLLVTSGFDGRILGWNINSYTENSLQFTELFSMQGLMRMRLTPDLSKLIICTTGGYMVLVHNLSLQHLSTDFQDFKPNMYRLMQISNYPLPQPASYTKLFSAKRNRVEFISDFPHGNDAELIHSLQVHPQGWSVLSRNTSTDNTSEWTCIHDIQDMEPDVLNAMREKLADENQCKEVASTAVLRRSNPFYVSSSRSNQSQRSVSPLETVNGSEQSDAADSSLSPRVEIMIRPQHERIEEEDEGGGGREDSDLEDDEEDENVGGEEQIGYGSVYYGAGERMGLNVQLRFTSRDVFDTLEHIEIRRREEGQNREQRSQNPGPSEASTSSEDQGGPTPSSSRSSDDMPRSGRGSSFILRRSRRLQSRGSMRGGNNTSGRVGNLDDTSTSHASPYFRNAFVIRTGLNNHRAILVLPPEKHYSRSDITIDRNHKIARNIPRLTNYIEEPNKGRGFIKELCFSSDGRLICSPFDCGVRLMMFDDKCSELSHCVQRTPQPLCAVSTNICHTNCVVSTKFSPIDFLLVSGCLNGKIVWHQPVL